MIDTCKPRQYVKQFSRLIVFDARYKTIQITPSKVSYEKLAPLLLLQDRDYIPVSHSYSILAFRKVLTLSEDKKEPKQFLCEIVYS